MQEKTLPDIIEHGITNSEEAATVAEAFDDILSGAEPDELTEEEVAQAREAFFDAFEGTRPVINRRILETIQEMVKQPGVVTLSKQFLNTERKPFRGKAVLYAVRMAEGERRLQSKSQARGAKQVEVSYPLIERRKLLTIYDMNAQSVRDAFWQDVITRFSAVYTVLESYLNSIQQHKLVTAEDAGRIAEVFDTEGEGKTGEETDEASDLSPGTDSASMENQKEQTPVAG